MARAGLNKHLVQQARDAIRARGQHPSLDAVRIELGNTGSKTTIHRYLKELDEEEGTRLDDVGLLSETLKEMVARLAARLHEEAHGIVSDAAAQHTAQVTQLQTLMREQQATLARVNQDRQLAAGTLDAERTVHQSTMAALQQESLRAQRLEEQVRGLEARLQEGEAHRQSLEEKHQHARDALEHYRQSVKEQREQDQRRHEAQIQQVQAELRQLQQTLMVKQDEITQLNRDNERLATENRNAQRQIHQQERQAVQTELAVKVTQDALAKIEGMADSYRQEISGLRAQESVLQAALRQAHTEQKALDELLADVEIAKLIAARRDGVAVQVTINEL